MGCGASSGKGAQAVAQNRALGDRDTQPGSIKIKNAQLTKINSQLGKKNIVNSFVVKKGRDRRRTDEGETSRKIPVERDLNATFALAEEPEEATAENTISFPAESGALAIPSFKGLSASGPSFKMQRGMQAQMLGELHKEQQLVDLPEYKACLYLEDTGEILKGVSYIREQLSVVNPPVGAIRASGILPRLVTLLRKDEQRTLQYEVAWTLTNICSAEHEDCQDVVDQGAVPEFVRMLETCDDALNVLEQAIWALGNVAADCADLQRYVLDEEVIMPLLACINRHLDNTSVLRHSMWLLSNLSRPKPQGEELFAALPTIMGVISVPDQDMEVATHACWSLAYMTSAEEVLDVLADEPDAKEVLMQLASWVGGAQSNLTAPALRVLGNMCSGNSRHTQAVLDAGALPALVACLSVTTRMSIKKEIVWSLSNVAAGTCTQVQALLEAGVFPVVGDLLRSSEETLARECAYVLANPWATKAVPITTPVAQDLLDAGLIKVLVSLLPRKAQPSIIMLALEGLSDALKKGQQMMRDLAKAAPPPAAPAEVPQGEAAPPEPPLPCNPVAQQMKANGAMEILQDLCAFEYEGLQAKANALKNMLNFM